MLRHLLALHVAGGITALLSGLVPLLSRKGGAVHRYAGRVFAGAMGWTALAGFVLAVARGNVLLLVIAVFTFFLVYVGVRAVWLRRGGRVIRADWIMGALVGAFSAWLLWYGLFRGDITSLAFGVAGIALALRQDCALGYPQTNWTAVHLGAMGGAYIATVSAVLVVNLGGAPTLLVFLGPAVIGTPLLVFAGRRYARGQALARVGTASV